MGGAFSGRKRRKEEEFLTENMPKGTTHVTTVENEKLDTDSDRIVGKKTDCLKTHEMISGTYIDMKIWQNFVPPPRP
ncbi:hypothetical protein GCK32_018377 [Trichostrongylus colubriformis]|uniref:Uncharacterized protein n=1 Tax=Trichostrongylus colubriformis TaxID=6319 RepID=A0AAN8IEE7_TRICO